MHILEEAFVQFGSVQYTRGVEAIPETRRQIGNDVHIVAGRDGAPAYFETSFWISADFRENGILSHNYFKLDTNIFDQPKNATYQDLNNIGVQRLSGMLREIADALDAQIAAAEA
jgi:hypothetical protein